MDRSSIVIDQVIHGYDRGHKQLSASLALDDQSRALMLEMSDSLVSADMREGQSYLVAYPLRNASKHVLARTWAAGKGYRPGSVWTHSLILDYQALTLIQDLVCLNSLFRLPAESTLNDYVSPIKLSAEVQSGSIVELGSRAVSAIIQIYSDAPKKDIVLPYSADVSDEVLALSLWRQMWPALRREFAFSTCVMELPINFDSTCTLRFSERELQKKLSLNPSYRDGYTALITDLPCARSTELRTFLNRYAIEGRKPRQLAVPLAQLYIETKSGLFEARLSRVKTLARSFSLPRLMRDAFVSELDRVSSAEELISIISAFKDESIQISIKGSIKLPQGFSDGDCRRLLAVTQSSCPGSWGDSIFEELVSRMSVFTLANIAEAWSRAKMLDIHPALVMVPQFWPNTDNERAQFIHEIKNNIPLDVVSTLKMLGRPIGSKTLTALFSIDQDLSVQTYADLLQEKDKETRDAVSRWIVSNPNILFDISMMPELRSSYSVESLAAAQVFLNKKITDPKLWERLVLALPKELQVENSTVVVAYVASLIIAKTGDTALIEFIFDKMQHAVSLNLLSASEVAYLANSYPYYVYKDVSFANISRSAISALSGETNFLGRVFNITRNEKYLEGIIVEISAMYGDRILEEVNESGRLNIMVGQVLRRYVKKVQDKKKSWLKW